MAGRIKQVVSKYERHVSAGALIVGFVFDNLTLQRIDTIWGYISLVVYLGIAATGIAILTAYEGGRLRGAWFDRVASFLPIIIQFVFGGLFSGFLVYYFRSATVSVNWPFILTLVLLLVGNEMFRKYYKRMLFNLGMLAFCIMSFAIFYVPILVGRIGDDVFAMSGFASLALIAGFIFILHMLAPKRIKEVRNLLIATISIIYGLITAFYFLNVIPPIPLSMKDAGVYHVITRNGMEYSAQAEQRPSTLRMLSSLDFRRSIGVEEGKPVYFYSAIFAPTNLSSDIVHVWQRYNEVSKAWVTRSRIQFSIVGGRDEGYRGYSYLSGPEAGRWRVRVETSRGRVIGIVRFNIERVNEASALTTVEL